MQVALKSTSIRVVLKIYSSTDHITAQTGKTVPITISKNGGAFANPNAGATNATEIGSGWYYVTLDATDTGTLGPLIVRGTCSGCDDSETVLRVRNATNMDMTALPDAAVNAATGLLAGNFASFDGTYTLIQLLKVIAAALGGKSSGGPGSPVYRDMSDTANIISATANSSGDRSAVTLNV